MSVRALRDRTWLVAVAAAMWGLDGLLRQPLATTINPATVVLWEHLIAIAILLPVVPRAIRAFGRCTLRDRVAIAVIGVGASAVGTALFTESFALSSRTGDYLTPLVLQKLQPLLAIALAVRLLRERLRPGFMLFALPALAGAWLLTFADPLDIKMTEAKAALFAVGAAALWASGTVLGRLVSPSVRPADLTTLRYAWGLPAAWAITWIVGAPTAPGWHSLPGLILLALIPGLLALTLYYRALARTAAARATLAELAFPATAAVVGVLFLNARLTVTQWVGFAVIVAAITGLGWRERSARPTVEPAFADAYGASSSIAR